MKILFALILSFAVIPAMAAETKEVNDSVCQVLYNEAKTSFKKINNWTYQHNGKVIEYFCNPKRGPDKIVIYSEKEYVDLVNQVKQFQQERNNKTQKNNREQLLQVRSLY